MQGNDEAFYFELYKQQVPIKQWGADILKLAQEIQEPDKLREELERRHPRGWSLNLSGPAVQLLEARGRDVMPYVRSNLNTMVGGWYGDSAKPFVKLAARKGWWDLWATAIRTSRNDTMFNQAVPELLRDTSITEENASAA